MAKAGLRRMISRRLNDYSVRMGITPQYIMRYSKGFIYRINEMTIWATNGDDGDTYWCKPHPYSMEELYALVDWLDTTDVLALFTAKEAI